MNLFKSFVMAVVCLLGVSCSEDWLGIKRDLKMVVPTTLSDMRALLNHNLFQYDYLRLAEVSADDYEITEEIAGRIAATDRNAYIWQTDIFEGESVVLEWDEAYKQVFQANVVLDGLSAIGLTAANSDGWQVLKGEALFFRAKAFYNLAQLFAPAYEAASADQTLGIPLRLEADVNARTVRATLAESYNLIVADLRAAASLLAIQPSSPYHPSKTTAYAQLARCYLVMGDYDGAARYADSSLQLNSSLIDYNLLNPSATYPIDPFNPEVLLPSTLYPVTATLLPTFNYVPDELLRLYDEKDLRRKIWFYDAGGPGPSFKGSYRGDVQLFQGPSTAEMLLIRAECAARAGNALAAMADLATLLSHRYEYGSFQPETSDDPEEVLKLVLLERRKELVKRGIRWQDLRRLNREPRFAQTLIRTLSGVRYELPPNDPRYVMPIPDYIINMTGIQPNKR